MYLDMIVKLSAIVNHPFHFPNFAIFTILALGLPPVAISHVAGEPPQPLRNARLLGVHFFETLPPCLILMALKLC